MTTQKPELRILDQATCVKNAVLVYNYNKEQYSLIHYDTEIMTLGKNKKVIKALKCSDSSTRAINQVCDFLQIEKPTLTPYTHFHKYNMSITKKVGKKQLADLNTEINWIDQK